MNSQKITNIINSCLQIINGCILHTGRVAVDNWEILTISTYDEVVEQSVNIIEGYIDKIQKKVETEVLFVVPWDRVSNESIMKGDELPRASTTNSASSGSYCHVSSEPPLKISDLKTIGDLSVRPLEQTSLLHVLVSHLDVLRDINDRKNGKKIKLKSSPILSLYTHCSNNNDNNNDNDNSIRYTGGYSPTENHNSDEESDDIRDNHITDDSVDINDVCRGNSGKKPQFHDTTTPTSRSNSIGMDDSAHTAHVLRFRGLYDHLASMPGFETLQNWKEIIHNSTLRTKRKKTNRDTCNIHIDHDKTKQTRQNNARGSSSSSGLVRGQIVNLIQGQEVEVNRSVDANANANANANQSKEICYENKALGANGHGHNDKDNDTDVEADLKFLEGYDKLLKSSLYGLYGPPSGDAPPLEWYRPFVRWPCRPHL
jgi:hypothetical protein